MISVTTGTADIASPKRFRNAPASFLRPSSAASAAWTRAPSLPSAIAASTLAKPRDDGAGLVRERERLAQILAQRRVDLVGEPRRHLDLGLEGPAEQAPPDRLANAVRPRRDPGAAARKLAPEIGDDCPVRRDDEADQPLGRTCLAGDDAGALRLACGPCPFKPDAPRSRPPRPPSRLPVPRPAARSSRA